MAPSALWHKRRVLPNPVIVRDGFDCEWFWHGEQLQQHHLEVKKIKLRFLSKLSG